MKKLGLLISVFLFLPLILAGTDCEKSSSSPGGGGPPSGGAPIKDFGTKGGYGGRILYVDNLEGDESSATLGGGDRGSLRWALAQGGPRIIVFEVGGVIDLERKSIRVTEPFVTIAGQTAPSPGITLIKGALSIRTNDVLVQHIRIRPGDAGQTSGWEPDGIGTYGEDAFDIAFDHISVSWAVDENVAISGPDDEGPLATSRRVRVYDSIISEGLNESTHSEGRHSRGALVHDYCREIAFIRNVFAHNVRRNPFFKQESTGVVVNNLIYNAGTAAIQMTHTNFSLNPPRLSIEGNLFFHGEDTRDDLEMIRTDGEAYVSDNLALTLRGTAAPILDSRVTVLPSRPFWIEGLEVLMKEDVLDYVMAHAGARPKDRDFTDTRILQEVVNRTGGLLNSQEEARAGGYPNPGETHRVLFPPFGADEVDQWLADLAFELE